MQKTAFRSDAGGAVYTAKAAKHALLTKTLLVMKLTAILLTVAFVQAYASGSAQTVTLSKKEVSLKDLFAIVKQQTGYVAFYSKNLLSEGKPVSITATDMPLEQFLAQALKGQPFSFRIEDKTISLFRRPAASSQANAVLYTDLIAALPEEDITLKGRITDTAGHVLPGVSVNIRGKAKTVTTDSKGQFTLTATPGDMLVITYVGHETLYYQVNKGVNTLSLKMLPVIDNLSDVVIEVNTGYQILQKSNFIGSAATVSGKSLYLNGINTLEQALQGKLAGVVIQNTSGLTGVRQRTTVRGVSTLSGSDEPVWVVDGIIQQDPLPFKAQELNTSGGITRDNFDYIRNFVGNSINWLNPNDIEDITVLKDAAATAIYGIKAANGVIVITTKRGKSGPVNISYNTSFSMTDKVDYEKLNMMSSKERVAVSREIYNRGLIAGSANINNQIGYAGALNEYLYLKTISAEEFNSRVAAMESENTDWFNILFRNPFSTNHTLSISGGSNNTSYYTSIGYNSSTGTAIGNNSKGYTANVSIMSRVNNKLTLSSRLSGSFKNTEGFYQFDPNDYATNMNRVVPAFNADGSPFFYRESNGYLYNAVNERGNTGNSNKVLTANAVLEANYEIIPGLRLQTLFSYNAISTNGETYATEQSKYVASTLRYSDYGTVKSVDLTYKNSRLPIGGELNELTSTSNAWNWRNSISYSKVFRGKHAIGFMFGQELQSQRYNGFNVTNYGYLRDRGKSFAVLPSVVTSANTPNDLLTKMTPKITDNLTNNMGLYLTGNYSYDNRYVFNMSVRTDRSNRFGQLTNEKFNPVYAGGARWNISNEKWFEKNSWLSMLSARASVGYQRNIAAGASPDLIVKISSNANGGVAVDPYTGDNLLSITKLPYTDLRWEQNLSVNLGLDLSLFNNKVQVSAEYYTKRGKDMITTLNIPIEYGVTSMLVNGGSMNNQGYEVTAAFVPLRTKNFTWSMSVNTSKNINTVKKVGANQLVTYQTAIGGSLYKEGNPVSGFYAFRFDGIDPTNGQPKIDLTYKDGADVANDPTTYMTYAGKANPDFTSGIGMNLRYKTLTLSTSFYLQLGGKKFLAPLYKLTRDLPTEYQNLSRNILDRWTPGNPTATMPGLPDAAVPYVALPNGKTSLSPYEMYNYSTDRIVSASSLRCNNLSLSYMVDNKLARRIGFKSINIGAGISNVFSVNAGGFRGIDPEVATGGQPRTRSYTCNINVSL
ncbi:SusC/RagA family TonB-linked outer membrane protein [Filimonas effusa]|uniref:SusC/RagA family TonB-linked outer membrane protein n=1 Tax=Filimonas effusa TaxID=2508721 RepID=A0A4Q1DC87_9BACT|nr:SusC/RagA family TonB-linked outer membrane protein [Filimonas effusa]RXK87067.1 SusC/RagA family TonB-linked outer membrane protein [Filimonas effusa]